MRSLFVAVSALFVLAGCSGSSATVGGGGGAADFIGSYTSMGTTTYSGCPLIPAPVMATGGSTIVSGPSNGITTQVNGCSLNWTVAGDVASLVAGQSCGGSVTESGETVMYTATWSSGTLTVSGSTITLSATGSTSFTDTKGTESCTFNESGTGTKS